MDSDSDQENNNATSSTSQQRKLYYRELLNKMEEIQESDDLGLETATEIGNIMKQVNNIETQHNITERYHHPEETLLDSMVLSSASDILVKCVGSMDIDSRTYEPAEFANKIMSYCKTYDEFKPDDLLKLLPDVQQIIPQVPAYTYIYGAYDLHNLPQPKHRKERQKQQRENFERKEPEKVKNLEKEEAGIDEIVKLLYDVLTECYEQNNEQAIKYYDYVIDTSSFSNSLENIFYCSFLVRDGRAHIDIDSKGEPYIKPMKKRQLKEFREGGGGNSQFISALTIPMWETFKKEGYIQRYKNQRQ